MVGGWVVVVVVVDDGCPSQVRFVPAMGWGQWVVWSGLLGGRVEGREGRGGELMHGTKLGVKMSLLARGFTVLG